MSANTLVSTQPSSSTQHRPSSQNDVNLVSEVESLRDRLLARFWANLRMPHEDVVSLVSIQEIVKAYTDSLQSLRAVHAEATDLIGALCQAHVFPQVDDATRPEKLTAAALKEVERLREIGHVPAVTVSSHLHAEIFGDEPEDAFSYLLADLERSTQQLVDGILTALEGLANEQVVGQIEWPVKSACRFRYYDTRILERAVRRKVEFDHGFETRTNTGEIHFQRHGCQQQLASATRQFLPKYQGLVPERVRNLLQEVPLWLIPEIEIVEGDLFRSDQGQRQVKTEEWTETLVYYDRDPAVTLGPYVLAAWLCEERHREQAQLQRDKREQQQDRIHQKLAAQHRFWKLVFTACVLQLIPLVLHIAAAWLWRPIHVPALILSLALLFPFLKAFKEDAWVYNLVPDYAHYVIGTAAALFGVLAVQSALFMFLYWSAAALVGFGIMTAASVYFGREFLQLSRAAN